jgi:hypothetical protein
LRSSIFILFFFVFFGFLLAFFLHLHFLCCLLLWGNSSSRLVHLTVTTSNLSHSSNLKNPYILYIPIIWLQWLQSRGWMIRPLEGRTIRLK